MQPSATTRHSWFDLHHIRLAAAITGVFVAGMVLGGLSREVDISNPFDDTAKPAIVAHVPNQAGDGLIETQIEGSSAGALVVTGDIASAPAIGDFRFQEQNLYLPEPVASPAKSYPLIWARFLETNGVAGALTEPARDFSRDWQRFRSVNGADGIETGPVMSGARQRFIEQNIYLPSDGADQADDTTVTNHPSRHGVTSQR